LDFRPATTVLRGILTIIPMVTLGTRTSTIIRMPGMHIHIIPPPQAIGTVGTGPTTVIITILITKVIEWHGCCWRRFRRC